MARAADIEAVQAAYDAFDFNEQGLAALLELIDEDVEWQTPFELAQGFGAGDRGHDRVRAWFLNVGEIFEEMTFKAEEVLGGGDEILVVLHWRGRAKGSGVPLDQRFYNLMAVRDGKVVRMRILNDRREAFTAAGLDDR